MPRTAPAWYWGDLHCTQHTLLPSHAHKKHAPGGLASSLFAYHQRRTYTVTVLARESHDGRRAQGHYADTRVVQGPILVGHDALPWQVGVEQHMIRLLMRCAKGACVARQALQQQPQPAAEHA